MFGKLVKYEFKAVGHWYLAMNGLILLASLALGFYASYLSRHYDLLNNGGLLVVTFVLLVFAFISLIIGQLIATLILIIRRFYSHLFGREGYLSLTLPVKESQLISSKLSAALALTIGNYLVIALAMGLIYLFINQQEVSEFSSKIYASLPKATVTAIHNSVPLWLLGSIVGRVANILLIYAAISVGQLFRNHRVLMAFISYFVIEGIFTFVNSFLQIATGNENIIVDYNTRVIVGILVDAVLAFIWYQVTHYIIKYKVDIQ